MLSDDQIEAFTAQYGRVKYVVYNGIDLVFRKPKRTECQQHASKLENPQEKVSADEALAQLLIVHCAGVSGVPDARKIFLEVLEEYPYICRSGEVGGALAKLTGVVQDDEVKTFGSASKGSGSPRTASPKA